MDAPAVVASASRRGLWRLTGLSVSGFRPRLLWGGRLGGSGACSGGRRQKARAVALDGAALGEDARQEVLVRILQAPIVDGFLWHAGHFGNIFSMPTNPWCRNICRTV